MLKSCNVIGPLTALGLEDLSVLQSPKDIFDAISMDRGSKEIGPPKLMMAFMGLVTYFQKKNGSLCAFGPL